MEAVEDSLCLIWGYGGWAEVTMTEGVGMARDARHGDDLVGGVPGPVRVPWVMAAGCEVF